MSQGVPATRPLEDWRSASQAAVGEQRALLCGTSHEAVRPGHLLGPVLRTLQGMGPSCVLCSVEYFTAIKVIVMESVAICENRWCCLACFLLGDN